MLGQFRLVDQGWWDELGNATKNCRRTLRIVCPFITKPAAEHILRSKPGLQLEVITRFNLEDWSRGVSSAEALHLLLQHRALIRGVQHLHAKLFVFDSDVAILGSTNLTHAALNKNHELGVVISHEESAHRCSQYFDEIWRDAGPTLTSAQLSKYEREFDISRTNGASKRTSPLPDYGAKVSRVNAAPLPLFERSNADGAFVKFFGTAENRYSQEVTIESELVRSGCHWACGYSRRPHNVKHGSVVFMARLMDNDTTIFGRAIAFPHRPGSDDATKEDIRVRDWREHWPYYARVLHPEFVAGTFSNGVSLFELMNDLGADTFVTTQRNRRDGLGNTNPRASLRRQPSMALTETAYQVLSDRLKQAFLEHGKLNLASIPQLDWPEHVNRLSQDGLRLLTILRQQLAAETIDLGRPETFPRYKEIVTRFGLVPVKGRSIVQQVRRQCGLDNLDEWTRRYGLPAISGLVVTEKDRQIAPGKLFFDLHAKQRNRDLDWWRDQVRRAATYDWDRVVD